jgi:hypothetical protein
MKGVLVKYVIAVALLLFGTACVKQGPVATAEGHAWAMEQRVGQGVGELLSVFGPPDDVFEGDSGLRHYVYRNVMATHVDNTTTYEPSEDPHTVSSKSTSRVRIEECSTTFDVREARVVDWHSRGSACTFAAPPWLGLTAKTMEHAVVITAVTPFGPADLAGLRKGDVILRVGSRVVQTQADVRSELGNVSGGSKMTMNIARRSRTRSVTEAMGYPPRDGDNLSAKVKPEPRP